MNTTDFLKAIVGQSDRVDISDLVQCAQGIDNERTRRAREHSNSLAKQARALTYSGLGMGDSVLCRPSAVLLTRDLQVGVFNQGGAFVSQIDMPPPIQPMVTNSVAMRAGARVTNIANGGVYPKPRITSLPTVQKLNETGTVSKSDVATDLSLLAPIRFSTRIEYTRQLELQSDIRPALTQLIVKAISAELDRQVHFGAGSNDEITGVFNIPGVGSTVFGGTANWTTVLSLENSVITANVDTGVGSCAYVTSGQSKVNLKNKAKGATITSSIWNSNVKGDSMNGYAAFSTQSFSGNHQLLFGDYSQMEIIVWDFAEIIYDRVSRDTDGVIRLIVNGWFNMSLDHPSAFACSADGANS